MDAMVWIFVSPQNSYVENLKPSEMVLESRAWGDQEMRVEPYEWI